jgi:hypothetical protein
LPRGTTYPLMNYVRRCFNVIAPPLNPIFMPSTSKQAPPLDPTLLISISFSEPTYTFSMSSNWPANFHPSSTHINHRWHSFHVRCWTLFHQLASLIIIDYNTINDIYNIDIPQTPWWTQMWVQRVKTSNGWRVGAHSLACNTLGKGACWNSRMGSRKSDKQVNYS